MTFPRSELVMGVSVLFSLILTCCLPHPVAMPYTIVSVAYLFSFILFLFFLGRRQKAEKETQDSAETKRHYNKDTVSRIPNRSLILGNDSLKVIYLLGNPKSFTKS